MKELRGRKLIGLLVSLLLLSGCVSSDVPVIPDGNGVTSSQTAEEVIPQETPELIYEPAPVEVANNASDTPVPENGGAIIVLPDEPPSDVTWISPGKVMIGNFAPGARAEWYITVHNGNDEMSSFALVYRNPSRVEEGYVFAPAHVKDWVIIADATPILMPRETREVLVALEMPPTAISPGPKWEFWISIQDTTQEGTIITELCSRWLVQMA